jgi:hypothetical protein
MQKYIDDKNLMLNECKGCCRGSKAYKDELLISKLILQECKSSKKNLCIVWIDYEKAFDSMSDSWVVKSIELTGINNKIIPSTKKTMSYRETVMLLCAEGNIMEMEDI